MTTTGSTEPETATISGTTNATGKKIILGKDGKPCRSCNTLLDFKSAANMTRPATTRPATIAGSQTYRKDEPADVEVLGRSGWTLLHTMAGNYPDVPTQAEKKQMGSFLDIFSKVYPCSMCAEDFQEYIKKHSPKVDSRDQLGKWLCDAHNEVNRKLKKEEFDCKFWKKRWHDGWDDE